MQPLCLLRIGQCGKLGKIGNFAIPVGTTVYVARCREGGVLDQELRWT
jgi:hypothetical protein